MRLHIFPSAVSTTSAYKFPVRSSMVCNAQRDAMSIVGAVFGVRATSCNHAPCTPSDDGRVAGAAPRAGTGVALEYTSLHEMK